MKMPKFRHKPTIVEAEQFNCWREPYPAGVEKRYLDGEPTKWVGSRVEFFIKTLEGEHIVSEGDWVVTGVKGEKYPVKPDIFEATYDPVPAGWQDDDSPQAETTFGVCK